MKDTNNFFFVAYSPEGDPLVSLDEPEQKLFFAIFNRAYLDIVNNYLQDNEKKKLRREALKWIFSDDFIFIADRFSYDSNAFVKKIRKVLELYQ